MAQYKLTCSCGSTSRGEGSVPDACPVCGKSTSRMVYGELYRRPFLLKGRARHASPLLQKGFRQAQARYEKEIAAGELDPADLKIKRTSPDAPDMARVAEIKERQRHESRQQEPAKKYY